ncbi:hypothetical protein [Microbacterium invictum]|uniref:DUF3168 domain-containing protein n=1 Tax=Microbacterium invictum TaxID=515415 RepID=A0ABZ0VFJ5_9MICO|nr:hypothetical protein [Microbacterium invictum]WQB71964.1 hypothetical protein T9R20_08475 [Microbacterium invictum]
MSFEFATVSQDLATYLTENVPEQWQVLDAEKFNGTPSRTILTYSQGNVTTSVDGQTMPRHALGVEFLLGLSVPGTDAAKTLPKLNAELPHLIEVLDTHPQLLWTTAERGRTGAGESFYALTVVAITTLTIQE